MLTRCVGRHAGRRCLRRNGRARQVRRQQTPQPGRKPFEDAWIVVEQLGAQDSQVVENLFGLLSTNRPVDHRQIEECTQLAESLARLQ